jgi:hypothetical protein
MPERDPDDFVRFITLRAAGNVIYFLGMLIRSGVQVEQHRSAIDQHTHYLMSPEAWPIVKNQTRIIDSIMFAASSVGNRALAAEMAKLNGDNFGKIAHERPLQSEEKEMWVRAEETAFLIESDRQARPEAVIKPPIDASPTPLRPPERARRAPRIGSLFAIVGVAVLALGTALAYLTYPETFASLLKLLRIV